MSILKTLIRDEGEIMAADQPRIPPQPEELWTDEVRAQLCKGTPDGQPRESPFMRTLAWNPRLYTRWAPFAGTLLARGTLPARDREVAVLRTLWLTQCGYEWAQHVDLAHQEGLTEGDIESIAYGSKREYDDPLEEHDRTLLGAVDELHDSGRISDNTWDQLARVYSEAQLIELVMLVGNYHLIAWVLNSVEITSADAGADLGAR